MTPRPRARVFSFFIPNLSCGLVYHHRSRDILFVLIARRYNNVQRSQKKKYNNIYIMGLRQ